LLNPFSILLSIDGHVLAARRRGFCNPASSIAADGEWGFRWHGMAFGGSAIPSQRE
jgi:hypothetical protein